MGSLIVFLLLLAAVYALTVGGREKKRRRRRSAVEDADELADAEAEVQELDAFVDEDDTGDHLKDWGPGAGPRKRR